MSKLLELRVRMLRTGLETIHHDQVNGFLGHEAETVSYKCAVNPDGQAALDFIEQLGRWLVHDTGCNANDLDPLDHAPCICGLRNFHDPFGRADKPETPSSDQASTTVSDDLLASMLAGIEGVTPGPYNEAVDYDFQTDPIASFQPNDAEANGGKRIANFFGPDRFANARHAQRCDPDTMRSILTELLACRAAADVTKIIGYQWRSKLGPVGWDHAEFSMKDPRPLPDQFEVREVFAAIKMDDPI